MKRLGWTAVCALAGVVLSSSCELRPTGPSTQELAELRVSALVAGTPIDLLVVRVTASDIPTPLVFNLPVQNGVAQGTIRLPPGIKRMITVDAYDTDGDITAEGIKTIDVKPGQNPPVSIPLVSKAGQVTITVTIGPVSVVVQPTAPTVQVGATLPLAVTITAANGDVLAGPADWATTNPAVATVDGNGNVMGVIPGTVDIVASFAGVAGVSHVTVLAGLSFATVSAGVDHTCGVTTAGAAYCWGNNGYGQLGDGTTTDRTSPEAVQGGLGFASVRLGAFYSCGVTTAGAAYCWGDNSTGQLGDGTTTSRTSPVAVTGGLSFAAVSAGLGHTCGVTTAGAAYCWGYNAFGQLGDGTTTDSHAPVHVVQ